MKENTSFPNLCFDDILLIPNNNIEVETRANSDISIELGNPDLPESRLKLYSPLMIAPMEFISSVKMLNLINRLGGIGFVQRYQDINTRISQISELKSKAGFALSVSECYDQQLLDTIFNTGCRVILIDTAVGNNRKTIDAVEHLRSNIPSHIHISTGNISTFSGYDALIKSGADSVRVGIGGGAGCTTRTSTGFGTPTLSSIIDVYSKINKDEINGIIADGGIKTNGDIVKSLSAGASVVMMGSLFAGHDECDGEVVNGKREFRGMASERAQDNFFGKDRDWAHHVEGAAGWISEKGSAEKTIQIMINNIKSGLSYANANNLFELRKNVEYIRVSPLSVVESGHRV